MCRVELPTSEVSSDGDVWSIRRLTREELARTFAVLTRSVPVSLSQLPPDEPEPGDGALGPSSFEIDLYAQLAREAAEAGAPALLERWNCKRSASCLQISITGWIERAYRSPLAAGERDAYLALFSSERDPLPALRELLQLIFQSPRFLYVIERGIARGEDDATRELSPFEFATRLSYFFWSEPPDDALLEDARSGRLIEPEIREAQVRRLLQSSKAARTLGRSLQMWAAPELDIVAKANSIYPEFDEALRASMIEQFATFSAMAIADDLSLADLLRTTRAPIDVGLAALLEVPASDATRSAHWIAELPPPRFGLLTLPGVLAANARSDDSSPVQRGLFIRQAVLCQPVAPPPPGVATLPPIGQRGRSFRERFEEHTRNPACAGCHDLMDPLGFPFEIFDGLGRLRVDDTVPTGGRLDGVASPVTFADLPSLVDALIEAPEVSRCWAEQWLRRAMGPGEGTDARLLDMLSARVQAGASWREILVAIASSQAFSRVRRPQE